MDSRLDNIESRIASACAWAQENGWRLIGEGTFGDAGERTCCALGAVAAQECGDPDAGEAMKRILGISDMEYGAVGIGFDGGELPFSHPSTSAAFYEIGVRLRRRFLCSEAAL